MSYAPEPRLMGESLESHSLIERRFHAAATRSIEEEAKGQGSGSVLLDGMLRMVRLDELFVEPSKFSAGTCQLDEPFDDPWPSTITWYIVPGNSIRRLASGRGEG